MYVCTVICMFILYVFTACKCVSMYCMYMHTEHIEQICMYICDRVYIYIHTVCICIHVYMCKSPTNIKCVIILPWCLEIVSSQASEYRSVPLSNIHISLIFHNVFFRET